jgi:H+-transporting ATPase
MSTSSGNSPTENRRSGPRDVEQGHLETEKQHNSPNPQILFDENIEGESDEYDRLLKFIDIEAKKEKRRRDRGDGEDEEQVMRRVWYMPWKKVPVKGTGAHKVPLSWLETSMSQGLSDPEVVDRRDRFGYNELERYAKPNAKQLQQKVYHATHLVRE